MSDGKSKLSWFRFSYITRLLIPAAITAILLLRPTWLRGFISSVNPFYNISTAIASRTAEIAFITGLSVIIICMWFRRWFCRWLCPVGLACETCGHFRSSRTWLKRIVPIGQYLAIITIGGAIFSVPFFLMLDPIVMLSGAIGMSHPAGWIFMGILAVILIASLFFPGIWCVKLCPLGGMQELMAAPAAGIKRRKKDESSPDLKKFSMARRSFLGIAAGVAAGFAMRWIISPVARRFRPPGAVAESQFKTLCVRCGNCVRVCPSSIIDHDTDSPDMAGILAPKISFESDWCRQDCNLCGQSCPSGAIEPLSLEEKSERKIGLACVDDPKCRLSWEVECDICVFVCPWEAIDSVFFKEAYRYTIAIDPEKCNGCGRCKIVCPEKAISMEALPCEDS